MADIWFTMIVILCTASLTKDTYTGTTYRVSDEDFDALFTDAVVTRSSVHCLTLCTTNRTNIYYDINRCHGVWQELSR